MKTFKKGVNKMNYVNYKGLINANKNTIFDENSILYTVEYLFLTRHGGKADMAMYYSLIDFLADNKNGDFHNQVPADTHVGTHEQYTSHDQLVAILALYRMFNQKANLKIIGDTLLKNLGTYDNVKGGFNIKRMMLPYLCLYSGFCNNNILAWLLFPLYAIMMIWTCARTYKDEAKTIRVTDGKLLFWLQYQPFKDNLLFRLLFKVCSGIIKRNKVFGSWKNVFAIYFKDPEHPIRKLSDELGK
jgi:hypothetical protein